MSRCADAQHRQGLRRAGARRRGGGGAAPSWPAANSPPGYFLPEEGLVSRRCFFWPKISPPEAGRPSRPGRASGVGCCMISLPPRGP
ncbi:hypothetical protein Ga0080559_TMP861 [Salipiger profundus]|uniref:Uncharacterized protein n=1 Tax=Salipiger profundus TaxID=1229727 RepID=A0A1U7D0H9_9RHOB|nr:hypothetical protein Ga0080559_TMP861 [Salipiger profundus]